MELIMRRGDVYASLGHDQAPSFFDLTNISMIEPNLETLLEQTIKLYIDGQILRMMLESTVCEQLAARQAMQKATEAAEDLRKRVNREYRRKRQTEITQEILEIVAGSVESPITDPQNIASSKLGDVPPNPMPTGPISPLGP
mmetsp:Transcript_17522/g.42779  ORF Transcript_17522/g.42779 Transcript_17522/m.42779 type:complete len:142 (+) Transcript_17522:338-763(+)